MQIEEVQRLCQRVEELGREVQMKEERAILEALVHKETRDKQTKLIENLQSKVWSFEKWYAHVTSHTYNNLYYYLTG